jgi:hypothetical protein
MGEAVWCVFLVQIPYLFFFFLSRSWLVRCFVISAGAGARVSWRERILPT